MNDSELKDYLLRHTNMTEHDIELHIHDGVRCYPNNGAGYVEFSRDLLAMLFDVDDIPKCWDELEIIGDYRFDWTL